MNCIVDLGRRSILKVHSGLGSLARGRLPDCLTGDIDHQLRGKSQRFHQNREPLG